MGMKLHKDLRLDRIDNSLGYCPENCRWVTAEESANNRTNSRWVWAFGEKKTISQWSRDSRCIYKYSTLHKRISCGIPPEQAISCRYIQYPKSSGYKRVFIRKSMWDFKYIELYFNMGKS
jgi:hypothetical protein